jgi:hypothetical protein
MLADSVQELGTVSPRSPIGVPGALEGVLGSSLLPGSFCITICVAFSSPFCNRNIVKIIPKQRTKPAVKNMKTTYIVSVIQYFNCFINLFLAHFR